MGDHPRADGHRPGSRRHHTPPATTAITASLSRGQQGVASALNDTSREIGGALGIALLGSIFNSQYSANVSDVAATLDPAQGKLVEEGIAGALQVSEDMGSEGLPVLTAAREALVDAWASSMWVGAAIALGVAAGVLILSLGKKGREDMAADGVLGDEPADHTNGADDRHGVDMGREPTPADVGAASGNGRNGGNGAGVPDGHVPMPTGETTVRL